MMGLTPGSSNDEKGVFALLGLISDPAAAQARLKEITAKSVEAQAFMEQARQANLDMEAKRAEVDGKLAKLDSITKAQAAADYDLKQREAALSANIIALKNDASTLADAKAKFAADMKAANDDLAKRQIALTKAEQDHYAAVEKARAEIKSTIASALAATDAQKSSLSNVTV